MTAPGFVRLPLPHNEPVLDYAPGSKERIALAQELDRQQQTKVEVLPVVAGQPTVSASGSIRPLPCPHDHSLSLGSYQEADEQLVSQAIDAALTVAPAWRRLAWQDRAAIFLKAATLLTTKYRQVLNAATILGQSKSIHQAEIDSACELADFWRFNPAFAARIYQEQPLAHAPGTWNQTTYRSLEGFVFALTPFNFTAIAGNLPTAPALMGNVVVWKPASSAVLSAHYLMHILHEAGLPAGVINLVPGRGSTVGKVALAHPAFAGLHFTGSTDTFNGLWRTVANNLCERRYRSYPRLVGETGGKDFVLAAPDADPETLAAALFRGAFEYQGQKCSAASRAYLPRSLWPEVRDRLVAHAAEVSVGDPADFTTFMGAVIDRAAFERISSYLDHANSAPGLRIVTGGRGDDRRGWFVPPTVVAVDDPTDKLMVEEIFGPILAVHVYDDDKLEETVRIVDESTPYGLTGAIFAKDRVLIRQLTDGLEHAAGNFYINDKPTGAVVGQQPFGGARASGTNDKAGSAANLMRWTNMRTIKENFAPPAAVGYPHMQTEGQS